MRVTYVIDSLATGGAERSLVDMLAHLQDEGVEVSITVLVDRPGLTGEARDAGARVRVLGPGRYDQRVRALRSQLVQDRPDIVHTTLFDANLVGRVAARAARTTVVSSLVNTPYGPDHLQTPGISVARLRAGQVADASTARLVARFHANSSHVAETMAHRLRIPVRKIDVVPRGRDPSVLGERSEARRMRARSELGLEPDDVMLLTLARHEHQKGLDVLVRAVPEVLARIPRARVFVGGGQGSTTAALRQAIGSAGLEGVIELLGVRDDVGDLLSASDVFVLPSRREGFPGVIVEAMALRAPIVATGLPGTIEALGESNGLFVEPDDPTALARAVFATVVDRDATASRVERAYRRFSDRFTTVAVSRQMVAFYERALGGRGRSTT